MLSFLFETLKKRYHLIGVCTINVFRCPPPHRVSLMVFNTNKPFYELDCDFALKSGVKKFVNIDLSVWSHHSHKHTHTNEICFRYPWARGYRARTTVRVTALLSAIRGRVRRVWELELKSRTTSSVKVSCTIQLSASRKVGVLFFTTRWISDSVWLLCTYV